MVLGTEAGMITSIVRKVQAQLAAANRPDIEVPLASPTCSRFLCCLAFQPKSE